MLLLSIFILFSYQTHKTSPPEKIKGIPQNAFWVGGIDGGSWYLIKNIDSIEQTALFKIYHDTNGEIWINKKLKLNCSSNTSINWSNLKSNINAFDGNRVYLLKTKDIGKECFFE